MKLAKLLLIPLLVGGLASCSPSNNDNSSSLEQESVQTSWSYSDEASMKRILHGNVVPYFSSPSGGKWNGVLIGDDGINKTYGIAYEIEGGTKQNIIEMKTSLLALGFEDVTNPDRDTHPKLILKLKDYEINKEVLVAEPQMLTREGKFGGLFYYQADQIKWNQKDVDKAIYNLLDRDISLPEPEFSFTKFEMFLNKASGNKTVAIGLFTDDPASVNSYYQTLEKNGYLGEEIESKPGQMAYFDPDYKINVTAVYNAKEHVCVIGVIAN